MLLSNKKMHITKNTVISQLHAAKQYKTAILYVGLYIFNFIVSKAPTSITPYWE